MNYDGQCASSGLSSELDSEGGLEEFGQRLCVVLATLGENHFKTFSQQVGVQRVGGMPYRQVCV